MKETSPASAPAVGDVLIAHPGMAPNLFSQTLVYLYAHSGEGSMGLILNRPSGKHLPWPVEMLDGPGPAESLPVLFGGPVEASQLIPACFELEEEGFGFRCHLGDEAAEASKLPGEVQRRFRLFLGYAGWSPGQLMEEVKRGDWGWTSPDEIMVRAQPQPALWALLATSDLRWHPLRAHLPDHPEWN